MKHFIDEYGEAVAGAVAAVIITGIAVALFTGNGLMNGVLSILGNNAI